MRKLLLATILPLLAAPLHAEAVKVATYNIENFRRNFIANHLSKDADFKGGSDAMKEKMKDLLESLRAKENEENWEVAEVFLAPEFSPDVVVMQECCDQEDLEYFNKRWLKELYGTVLVLPSNDTRGQNVAIMLKPGFKVVEKRDQYFTEKDLVENPRGDRLFARGPSFLLIESPGGNRFWVGTNHQKSKSGNDVEVTKWRRREAVRTNAIIHEIATSSPTKSVLFLGDMNDELGVQAFETEAGGDVIAALVGSGDHQLELLSRGLVEKGVFSYGGYGDDRYRSYIDHVFCTPNLKPSVKDVHVFSGSLTRTASDHYPVLATLELSK
jgi:hypothetical protein